MATKSPLEMAAQSLVEISHMQRESIDAMAAAQKEGFNKIDTVLVALAEQQLKLTASVEKLGERIDNLSMVVQSQAVTSQTQSENITLLIKHAASLSAKAS